MAESTHYEEAYGETLYVETGETEQGKIRGLYLPDGTLLKNLQGQEALIGKKKEEADIVLEDASVSRVHAIITTEREYYYLEDMIYTKWLLLLLRQAADVVLLTISDLSDVH